ncbi:unnamed protein product [Paramecium sonneborni]|uniref:Uncharacterized protein n=1 Tax=Paramecium sonneborni TaxID=65129 RepID=A0A8S1L0P7_9CILI|nr:unnamed protein product [Paramecium sonneborni]
MAIFRALQIKFRKAAFGKHPLKNAKTAAQILLKSKTFQDFKNKCQQIKYDNQLRRSKESQILQYIF